VFATRTVHICSGEEAGTVGQKWAWIYN